MSSPASNALAAARQARLSENGPLGARLRDAFREPHPFARRPATLQPYPVPWLSVYGKRTLRTFAVFVPLAVVVLGWPLAAKGLINLSNKVHSRNSSTEEVPRASPKSHKAARRAMLQQGPVRLEA